MATPLYMVMVEQGYFARCAYFRLGVYPFKFVAILRARLHLWRWPYRAARLRKVNRRLLGRQ